MWYKKNAKVQSGAVFFIIINHVGNLLQICVIGTEPLSEFRQISLPEGFSNPCLGHQVPAPNFDWEYYSAAWRKPGF